MDLLGLLLFSTQHRDKPRMYEVKGSEDSILGF